MHHAWLGLDQGLTRLACSGLMRQAYVATSNNLSNMGWLCNYIKMRAQNLNFRFKLYRRSADVRSVGYSELLCLSKKDLMKVSLYWDHSWKMLESSPHGMLPRSVARYPDSISHPRDSESPLLDFGSYSVNPAPNSLSCIGCIKRWTASCICKPLTVRVAVCPQWLTKY